MENEELIPLLEGQEINHDNYYKFCPHELKIEVFYGKVFGTEKERKNFLMMLLYNIGLKDFVKMLPEKSKEILKELLNNE